VRQIQLQRLPVVAIVEGNPNTLFRAGKEQPFSQRILANRVDGCVIRQTIGDALPGLAAIVRSINVGVRIVNSEAADGSISGSIIEVRSDELCDFAPRSQRRRSNVLPAGAAIPRDPEQAVIGASPNGVNALERRCQSINDASLLVGVRIFACRVSEIDGYAGMGPRQVRADGLPVLTTVGGSEDKVGGVKECMRVDRRKENRLLPVRSVLGIGERDRRNILRVTR